MFVCLICKKVFALTCPTCPDRGGGRGATVEEIKDAIRAAPNVPSINAAAKDFGPHVVILSQFSKASKTMAIQIKNLAAYRRKELMREQK